MIDINALDEQYAQDSAINCARSDMSVGEVAFLVLVLGCFLAFAASVIWLRHDYVRVQDRQAGRTGRTAGHIQARLAE